MYCCLTACCIVQCMPEEGPVTDWMSSSVVFKKWLSDNALWHFTNTNLSDHWFIFFKGIRWQATNLLVPQGGHHRYTTARALQRWVEMRLNDEQNGAMQCTVWTCWPMAMEHSLFDCLSSYSGTPLNGQFWKSQLSFHSVQYLSNPWIADISLLHITNSFRDPNCRQTILNDPI